MEIAALGKAGLALRQKDFGNQAKVIRINRLGAVPGARYLTGQGGLGGTDIRD